jgi:ABC-2 type transport system ATP-binding protein
MSDDPMIVVKNLYKTFKLPHEKYGSLKSAVINVYKRQKGYELQKALSDISFEVKKGEFFGIVGRNGSGKSTLLKLLAGIYRPDQGTVQVNGKLTPFIELGVGFNPELTGRENVFLNGALLGFNRNEMKAMYNDIVEFAEIERFMDQKLKNYSSGMQVRLAFSIAIRAESDILVLDEVLAVGDAAFQRKCYDYFMSLKKNKRTVVLVTHDMGAVRQYCDRAIMIEKSRIVKEGSPEKIAQAYQKLFIGEITEQEKADRIGFDATADRWGDGQILSQEPHVTVSDDIIEIKTSYIAQNNVMPPIYGFTLYDPKGNDVVENNTLKSQQKTDEVVKGDKVEVVWKLPNIFVSGRYSISVACCNQNATQFYDWVNNAAHFTIRKETSTAGLVEPTVDLHYSKNKVNT